MNISKQNIDELNATLKIQFGKEDYQERVEKVLADYRRKANMPGFRPGKVPAGLIQKMYGKAVLADEINKLVSEKINEYIKSENIHILGDPLPSETQNKTIDFDTDTEFEFFFDLGLAPAIDTTLSKKDKITYYDITVDDKMVENYIGSYTRRYGKFIICDKVEADELVKGDLTQVDEQGNVVEGGIHSAGASVYLELAKDENEKAAFKGAKVGDVVKFDIKKAFPNDFEISNLLKIEKEKVAEIASHFQMTIGDVSRFEQAPLDTELFDKVYGEGVVTTEVDFRNKVSEEISSNLKKDADYKFGIDTKEYFLKKLNIGLPEAFMKRWLAFINEGKLTVEQIETEYPAFENDMKWQLIKNEFAKANNIEVKEDEVIEQAKEVTLMQFRQYGINNIPDEQLQMYAVNLLKKENEVRRIVERVMENKIVAHIKENVTLSSKAISNEEFGKLFA